MFIERMKNDSTKFNQVQSRQENTRFFDFRLNNTQIEAFRHLLSFLKSDNNIFILKGYAGTGKTTLLKGLSKYLNENRTSFICMVPTGRAAKIIAEKTGLPAHTIHKSIYSRADLREYKSQDVLGIECIKYFYSLRRSEDSGDTVYLVDEASMISNLYANGGYLRYGSGFLLNDFLEYVGNRNKRKIIFIGDPAQLPPVNMETSPALDKNYLEALPCHSQVEEFEMREVVRQCQDSGILATATHIRENINQQHFYDLSVVPNERDILPISTASVAPKYIELTNGLKKFNAIIITLTNYSVNNYNQAVRNRFWGYEKEICTGDRIIVVQNNYSHEIELMNGEFGIVINVSPQNESRKVSILKNSEPIEILLYFRNVSLRFESENGTTKDIHCKILMNLLNSAEPKLTTEELQALYVDFKQRNRDLKPNTPEFKEAIEHDSYFNCLRIKYGYAITCHKAQGGEWEQVIVDFRSNFNRNTPFYFRWAYTALTRAQKKVYSLSQPNFTRKAESLQ
ncbi:MAG: hypothetical protein COT43_01775 [Candidatus Marinimicrobia bacterium CG08_land_8_20_14_0_20_45_22]|nr:MAG: hypothetical protein COT43_01775 [Candidatus Marinimicrobia bacterium CG08_land_8_20_14_0_20_45_22]